MSNNTLKKITTTILIPLILIALSTIASNQYSMQNPLTMAAMTTLAIHWLIGIPSIMRQTEKLFDITGSIGVWAMLLLIMNTQTTLSTRALLLSTLCAIWTTRLGIFLLIRIQTHKVDKRFNELKKSPNDFFNTWQLSAAWTFITLMCALSAITSPKQVSLNNIDGILICLWIMAFLIECIADIQKFKFKSQKQKTPFIQSGLWKYSRHPNYLGEIIMWIAIALMSFPNLENRAYISLISPLFVIVLLTKISGINLLEKENQKKFKHLKSYQHYVKTTGKLIPKIF